MEKYTRIFKAESLEKRPFIKPFEDISFEVNCESTAEKRFRLFFTGETNIHYTWKSEPDCWVSYGKIDDSLSSKDAYKAQYCVKLEGCDYPKILYKKVLGEANLNYFPASYFDYQKWQPVLSYLPLGDFTEEWKSGIFIKGENIVKKDGAKLRMLLEVREYQRGVSRHDITVPPTIVYEIDFPEGSYDWHEITKEIILPKTTCSVCVFIEAENFEGNLYLESPYIISSNGFNILPDFSVSGGQRTIYNWLGQNLSKKEWPNFEISANGEVFFSGELFERCHRNSECEVNIPDGVLKAGKNTITIKLTSDFRDAPSYSINEVALLEEPKNDFNVISCPEVITAGAPFSLLLQINRPVSLTLESDKVYKFDDEALVFDKEGLVALRLICDKVVNDLTFTLKTEEHREQCTVMRSVEKPMDDKVIVGSSDMVYVRQTPEAMDNFLRFYMGNQIGNFITIRPVYRWSGTRKYNHDVFSKFVPLMNKLGMKYVNMTDGREPSGQCSNPPIEVMEKSYDGIESGFLGRQKHEQDGAYNYWFYNDFSENYDRELHYDLMMRNFQQNLDTTSHFEHAPGEQFFIGEELSIFKHKYLPDDMQGMHDFVVSQLHDNKYNNTRHTGPSFMYKYIYEAGFDWVGGELMYGPFEPVIAAMRGASRGYKKNNGLGAHLALQWSTYPHDVAEKYRRFRLALYICYMHGITDINTEEGITHIEEYFSYFNRFTDCCRSFLKQQQDFFRYTRTHTRSGEFYAPFAFLHGRCDGFSGFNRSRIWGKENWKFCGSEQSWDLIKAFYPVSELDGIYRHFCPTDEPVGFFTGTPRGNTDIIPIEKGEFDRYKAISFAAYNKADAHDFDNLVSYVENGGTLIMGWPHLSVTTDRASIENGKLTYINHKLVDIVAGSHAVFARDFFNGEAIDVCRNVKYDDVIATTDSGIPLAFIKTYGKGKIYFVNAEQYPSHEGVKPIYDVIIAEVSDSINASEKSIITCGNDVGYTVYEQADGSRHFYVLAVDWYKDPEVMRQAKLRVERNKYDIDVPFGSMLKIVVKDDVAAWSEDESVEILLITENIITLQGYGKTKIKIAHGGSLVEREIDFTKRPLQAITL
ncbi:MAG: hypothetical protein IJ370_04620 [Oscillospiraceae bacterium]|nr:hypothetical protein [Oscillospiraceae bacterium]